MKEKLRLGIYINNENIPLWIFRTIEKLVNSEFAEITLIFIKSEVPKVTFNLKYSLIYSFHEKLDYLAFRKRFDYNKVVSITGLLDGIQRVLITTLNYEQEVKYAINNNDGKIFKYDLDIILNFTSYFKDDYLFKLAKYGIWTYNLGDYSRENSNGYWELVKKTGISVSISISKKNNEEKVIIFRTLVDNYANSLHQNRDQLFGLASLYIPRIIRSLWLFGPSYIENSIIKYQILFEEGKNEFPKSPSSIEGFKNLLIILFRVFKKKLVYEHFENWFLLLRISAEPDMLPLNIKIFNVLMPPKDRFWADPFVVSKEERIYIFVEELLYKTKKGRISVLELDKIGNLLKNRPILEKPYHLSYPFVFEWNDAYYMIPETAKNNTIELYKCTHFPDMWEFKMFLMQNLSASDTTLFYYEKKWWLFSAVNEYYNFPGYFELFLFYSADLFTSKWTPHPLNPIVTGVSAARPAGKIFVHDDKIYRPSQYNIGSYGRAINLNQIVVMTETDYKEINVSKVEANWDSKLKGTHTLNSDKNITVIDAYKDRKRLKLF